MDNPWSILWDPTYKGQGRRLPQLPRRDGDRADEERITDLNTGKDADLETVRTDLLAMIDAVDPMDRLRRLVQQAAERQVLGHDGVVG